METLKPNYLGSPLTEMPHASTPSWRKERRVARMTEPTTNPLHRPSPRDGTKSPEGEEARAQLQVCQPGVEARGIMEYLPSASSFN